MGVGNRSCTVRSTKTRIETRQWGVIVEEISRCTVRSTKTRIETLMAAPSIRILQRCTVRSTKTRIETYPAGRINAENSPVAP